MRKIGIPGWKTGGNSYGATINYLEFIGKFGIPRVIMPDEEIANVDALLLPGGLDLYPPKYRKPPGFTTSNPDIFKQYFFDDRLSLYVGRMPIFGICLGMQMINVFFGGTLEQNIKFHPVQSSDALWEDAHEVKVIGLKNKDKKFKVNSRHHQAVLTSMLSPELIPLVEAKNEDNPNDPIIEALNHPNMPIAGVQWHPEDTYDEYSMNLFESILFKG